MECRIFRERNVRFLQVLGSLERWVKTHAIIFQLIQRWVKTHAIIWSRFRGGSRLMLLFGSDSEVRQDSCCHLEQIQRRVKTHAVLPPRRLLFFQQLFWIYWEAGEWPLALSSCPWIRCVAQLVLNAVSQVNHHQHCATVYVWSCMPKQLHLTCY